MADLVKAGKYEFNDRFQFKILSLLALVPNFQAQYGRMILPDYFESDIHSNICTILSDFAEKYKVAPSKESLENLILEHCRKSRYHVTDPKHMDMMLKVGRALYHADLSDKASIIDRVRDFARKRELQMALLEITDMKGLNGNHEISDRDYETIIARINKVRSVGEGVENLGTETFSILPKLPKILSDGSAYSLQKAIKTPFSTLDRSRPSKGLGPTECLYIIGSSGQGKSIIKNCCGLYGAMQLAPTNRWVAHATLELSELDNHMRYAANILDITQEEIMSDPKKYAKKIGKLTLAAQIHVKWFRPAFTTPNMISNWIAQLASVIGHPPGMLIVDYPDKLRPSGKSGYTGNLFIDGGTISDELIGVLADWQIPGIFSSQLQRAAQYSATATGSDVATSMAKIYNADVVGIICQDRQDKVKGLGQIWWDKNRRGKDSFYSKFRIDYAKARIDEDDSPQAMPKARVEDVMAELEADADTIRSTSKPN